MKKNTLGMVVLILFTWAGVIAPAGLRGETLALVGGTIIDGTGASPLRDGTLVVERGRITSVGERMSVPVPDGARVIDVEGKWIIPGLIDAHVHFFQSGGLYTRPDVVDLRRRVAYREELHWFRDRLEYTFSRYLCSGVTGVLDAGGSDWVYRVRERARGGAAAPRVSVSGPLITTYVSPLSKLRDTPIMRVTTPAGGRRAVRRVLKKDPDLIKVWFIRERGVSIEDQLRVYRAVIETSHARGTRVIAHAQELETARAVVEAGADILAHSVKDRVVDREFVDLLKEREVIYVTTLMVSEGYEEVLTGDVRLTEMEKRCADPAVVSTWDSTPTGYAHLRGRFAEDEKPILFENLRILHGAGVTIAAGSDAGNIGSPHGPALHREIALMAEAGLSPEEIILAATRNAARVLHPDPDFGTLEEGKRAELVILSGDPLADITNVGMIEAVVAGGRYMPHHELAAFEPPPGL